MEVVGWFSNNQKLFIIIILLFPFPFMISFIVCIVFNPQPCLAFIMEGSEGFIQLVASWIQWHNYSLPLVITRSSQIQAETSLIFCLSKI